MSATRKHKKETSLSQAAPSGARKNWMEELAQAPSAGTVFLLFILLLVAILSGLNFKPSVRVFLAGEIATQDVTADQDLLVEERESTADKRKQVAQAQPPVFDLNPDEAPRLETKVNNILAVVNRASHGEMDQIRWQIVEHLNSEISSQSFTLLRNNLFQNSLYIRILPWLGEQLRAGVAADERQVHQYANGIIIRDLSANTETLRTDLREIKDIPHLKEGLDILLRRDLNKSLPFRRAMQEFIDPLLQPSLSLNVEATQSRIKEVTAAVEPVYYHIKRGEVIVRQGERVGPQAQLKLQALVKRPDYFPIYRPLGIFILGAIFMVGLTVCSACRRLKSLSGRDAFFIGLTMLLFAGLAKALSVIEAPLAENLFYLSADVFPYIYPVAGAAGLMALYFPPSLCIFANLLLSFLVSQMFNAGVEVFCYYFIGSMVETVLIKRSQTRQEVLKSFFPLLGGLIVAWIGSTFLRFHGAAGLGVEAFFVFGSAFLSLLVVFALSPIVDMVFGFSSRFKLLEQMNLEHPLLQELMVVAPGTYHHSLIVANMVEAGARAIGANALLCKVAALYHDIGKVKNPQYFIENQYQGKNRHDKLAPSMSALILIGHVKKGVELAAKHKLGQEIMDIIEQHHGNSLISFFYHKAMDLALAKNETVREDEYRYPGPRPQTREAAIVLLADAIEASGRTLVDPTPVRIKAHIDTITKNIFSQGQLDESELTLKDLHLLGETFHRILTGIFHQRIEYPNGQRDQTRQSPVAEPEAAAAPIVASPGCVANVPPLAPLQASALPLKKPAAS